MNNRFLVTFLTMVVILSQGCAPRLHEVDVMSEVGRELGIGNVYKLGSPMADDLVLFFDALNRKDVGEIYSYSSALFRERVPIESFEEAIGRWSLRELKVLDVDRQMHRTVAIGFMLIIEYRDRAGENIAGGYSVMFWRIEDGSPRFMNFPFISSRVPDVMDLGAFYNSR